MSRMFNPIEQLNKSTIVLQGSGNTAGDGSWFIQLSFTIDASSLTSNSFLRSVTFFAEIIDDNLGTRIQATPGCRVQLLLEDITICTFWGGDQAAFRGVQLPSAKEIEVRVHYTALEALSADYLLFADATAYIEV